MFFRILILKRTWTPRSLSLFDFLSSHPIQFIFSLTLKHFLRYFTFPFSFDPSILWSLICILFRFSLFCFSIFFKRFWLCFCEISLVTIFELSPIYLNCVHGNEPNWIGRGWNDNYLFHSHRVFHSTPKLNSMDLFV